MGPTLEVGTGTVNSPTPDPIVEAVRRALGLGTASAAFEAMWGRTSGRSRIPIILSVIRAHGDRQREAYFLGPIRQAVLDIPVRDYSPDLVQVVRVVSCEREMAFFGYERDGTSRSARQVVKQIDREVSALLQVRAALAELHELEGRAA